ncbi:MAG TPA: ATPase domain-containing protein [Ktedonobacteraceae bacterium]|nr:ATPase domain-containing protein [Ktedonobacteraceae bacterium]
MTTPPLSSERVSSGIAGLDRLLHGGLLKGRLYLIMGPPGSGKTILSNQICFHHVAHGGRVLYLTLLAETNSRLLADLQAFAFFRAAPISDTLFYVSGYQTLLQEGLAGLLTLLRTEIQRLGATMLVLDGAVIAEDVAPHSLDWKQFLHGLRATIEILNCTTFLLSPLHHMAASSGEQTLVEGIIELARHRDDARLVRELEIHKFRGSGFVEGRHLYVINETGVQLFPRIEALFTGSAEVLARKDISPVLPERLPVGIAQLDAMLHGGLPAGSTTLLLGEAGTGKTLLGSHFLLQGARQGQRGLYYGFFEHPAELLRKLRPFEPATSRFVADGLLAVHWQSPLQNHLDPLAEHLLQVIEQTGTQRLFLDGLDGFQRSVASAERLDLFLTALLAALRQREVTTICSIKLPNLFSSTIAVPPSLEGIISLVGNVVILRHVELRSQLYRLISILKMWESDYDPSIREFRIHEQGIEIAPTFASAEAILTGIAHAQQRDGELRGFPEDGAPSAFSQAEEL